MKAELTDVSETQKTLAIEIPSDVVSAAIDRVAVQSATIACDQRQ